MQLGLFVLFRSKKCARVTNPIFSLIHALERCSASFRADFADESRRQQV